MTKPESLPPSVSHHRESRGSYHVSGSEIPELIPSNATIVVAPFSMDEVDSYIGDDIHQTHVQLSPIRHAHTKNDHRQQVNDDYNTTVPMTVISASPQRQRQSNNGNLGQQSLYTTAPNSTATSPTLAESHATHPSLLTSTTNHCTPTSMSPPSSLFPHSPRPSYHHATFFTNLQSAAFENPGCHHFAFSPAQLRLLAESRTLEALDIFGGLKGLALGLWTDVRTGLSTEEVTPSARIEFQEAVIAARENRAANVMDIEGEVSTRLKGNFIARRETFGYGSGPKLFRIRGKAFLGILWRRLNDKLILVLLISTIITLALAAVQAKSNDRKYRKFWTQATTTLVGTVIVVLARTVTEWEMSRRLALIDKKKTQSKIQVIRSGRSTRISIDDLMVGDVVETKMGDVMPADGIIITADGIVMDEYSITGETRVMAKQPAPEYLQSSAVSDKAEPDPFIINGTVMLEGSGSFLVTSLRTPMIVSSFSQYPVPETALQKRLNMLARQIATWGMLAGVVYFVVLLIRYIVQTSQSSKPSIEKARNFFDIIVNVSIVLLVSVTSSLVFSSLVTIASMASHMFRQGNLVKKIEAVEIMGDVTCINTSKAGSLTMDGPVVMVGRVGHGEHCDFPECITKDMGVEARQLIRNAICLNTIAHEVVNKKGSRKFEGPTTEVAFLNFAVEHLGLLNLQEERGQFTIVKTFVFDPSLMLSAAIVKLKEGKYRVFAIGAAENILSHSEKIMEDYNLTAVSSSTLTLDVFESINASIHNYGRKLLRPMAIAYRDSTHFDVPIDSISAFNILQGMTFVCLFGLLDPIRPSMLPLVRQCHQAGVFVRLVTGDNFSLACEVASKCGIFTAGGIVMDGATFRALSHWQLDLVVPRLQVLARASPEDKLLLVTHLRGMGETVAAVGSALNDSLAIKTADVGFAMGSGSDAARESSDVVMIEEGFQSLVRALGWGRTISDSVRRFLQFQLTINITSGIITVISTFVGNLIISIPQLIWVTIISTVLGLAALTTDYPSSDLMARRPHLKIQPIITLAMWKMILCQALYQALSILTIYYVGWAIFEPKDTEEISDLQTLVFNIYIWMQIFNQHNCRRVDNNINVHHQGFIKSLWFVLCQVIAIVGQVFIVTQGGSSFNTKPLNGYQWAWSILFGFLTIPLGIIIRQIPDTLVFCIFQLICRVYVFLGHFLISLVPDSLRRHSLHTPTSTSLDQPHQWVLAFGASLLRPFNYTLCNHDEPIDDKEEQRPMVMSAPLRRARRQLQERILRQKNSREGVDLYGMVAYVRGSLNPVEEGIDVHPETGMNDPVLMKTIGVDGASDPPSQDPEIIKMLSLRVKK